ncbi:hypothetical protein FB451DRAFT_1213639 [Mycena latifolia]|nr:hypothetical protein FB451DRAFT_1213639 [Mycena latifolia]
MSTLIRLGEDVLGQLLACCDIHTILIISSVDRYLRSLTQVKQLWLSLIRDLQSLHLIELPPGLALANRTTLELIDLVKCIVSGPRTLASTSSSAPTIAEEVVLRSGPCTTWLRVKLLQGSRCVMLIRLTSLELWDISPPRQIWVRPDHVLSVGAQLVENGNKLTVCLVYRPTHVGARDTLEVLQVDLCTAEVYPSFARRLEFHNAFWDPCILGDFVAVSMRGGKEEAVWLINWREQTGVVLSLPGAHVKANVALLPGYLILTSQEAEPTKRERIMMYPLTALRPLFQPVTDLNFRHPVPIAELLPVLVESPALEDHVFREIYFSHMAVHASPLRQNAYQISLYLWGYTGRGPLGAFLRYMCILPDMPGGRIQSKLISTRPAPPLMQYHGFTYAGHAMEGLKSVVYHSMQDCHRGPGKSVLGPELIFPVGERSVWRHISPYGCVIATFKADSLRICYYV